MEKVYTLPDLLPAPTSDLQLLVRRLIEYADWSVLPALLDELKGSGREREIRWLQNNIAFHLCPPAGISRGYDVFVANLLGIYWFDLFDANATATALANKPFRVSRLHSQTGERPGWGENGQDAARRREAALLANLMADNPLPRSGDLL